ncbi:hypothetical protein ACOMHN_000235 [Nucella lapillus]
MPNNTSHAQPTPLLPVETVILTLAAILLSVVAIAGNGVLFLVVVRTSALRTCTNFFIASLSAGELLMGLFVIPFAGSSVMTGSWPFPSRLCGFVGFMGVLGPCVSALSLVVVSADRCVAISKPLRYASLVTTSSTVVIVCMVWAFSVWISLLPLFHWGQYRYSERFLTCLMRSSTGVPGRVSEVLVKEIFCVFIPVALIVMIVLKTAHHVRSHRRVFVFVPVPVSATSLPAGSKNVSATRSRVKATRTLLVVSAAFVLLCLPLAVADVLCQRSQACEVGSPILRTLLWLSFHSSVINPITIMTLNRKFRSTLRSLFCRKCGLLQPGPAGGREVFTVTSGLQAVLETTLLVNIIHGNKRLDARLRREVVLALQTRSAEDPQASPPGRVSVVLLRKSCSTPDCRTVGLWKREEPVYS